MASASPCLILFCIIDDSPYHQEQAMPFAVDMLRS
jgi:hypothetical protein